MTDPTYRPERPADSYARPEYYGGKSRIYFFDLDTREELKGHPLNGMIWCGSGAMVSVRGQYVDGSAQRVYGHAYLDGVARVVDVDADSFPGRRVAAKIWNQPGRAEWRILAKGDGSKPDGRKPRLPASTLSRTAA